MLVIMDIAWPRFDAFHDFSTCCTPDRRWFECGIADNLL